MKEINLLYRVESSYSYSVDLDEYEQDILDKYEKSWDELTKGERDEFIYNLGIELIQTAEAECGYNLETVESYEDEGEEFFL